MLGRTVQLQATDKQRLAHLAWENDLVDDVVYGGSAGGGKTILAGQVLTNTALKVPGAKLFLGRKELKTLMQTSYISLVQKVFPMYGLEQGVHWRLDGKYNVLHFNNGSRIDLLDLALFPSDPLYDRFGSSEYTRGWIEEASEVPFKAYDVLKSRVGRWLNVEKGIKSKLGLSLNPSQDWPYRVFYDPWNKAGRPTDPNKPLVSLKGMANGEIIARTFVFIPALYKDNPFTAGEYARNLATIQDPVLKQRLMDGDWEYASANDTLFHAQTIADLFRNVVAYDDQQYLIVDAARFGGDEIVLNHFRGWDSYKIDRYTMLPGPTVADHIRTASETFRIPREHILIDEDGVGGGILDLVPGAIGFHGGAAPFGKVEDMNPDQGMIVGKSTRENYENLRAQCTYHLAQKSRERKVRVSDENLDTREKIAEDLKQFKRRDADKDGKLKVTKKEEIKQALGRSPDVGDTFMMRSYFDLRHRESIQQVGGGTLSIFIPEYD